MEAASSGVKVSIYASIMHASWASDRKPIVNRLVKELAPIPVRIEEDYMKGWGSAQETFFRMLKNTYTLAADGGHTHCLFLEDDAELCPDFYRHVHALLAAKPRGQIFSLFNNVLCSPRVLESGHNWLCTADSIVTVGWVITIEALANLIVFMQDHRGKLAGVPYDNQVGLWAMQWDIPIIYPLPGLVEHLLPETTEVGSYICPENLADRKSSVRLLTEEDWPNWNSKVVDVGRKYSKIHWMLRTRLDDFDSAYRVAALPSEALWNLSQ